VAARIQADTFHPALRTRAGSDPKSLAQHAFHRIFTAAEGCQKNCNSSRASVPMPKTRVQPVFCEKWVLDLHKILSPACGGPALD
jgi:hypothetical protein